MSKSIKCCMVSTIVNLSRHESDKGNKRFLLCHLSTIYVDIFLEVLYIIIIICEG